MTFPRDINDPLFRCSVPIVSHLVIYCLTKKITVRLHFNWFIEINPTEIESRTMELFQPNFLPYTYSVVIRSASYWSAIPSLTMKTVRALIKVQSYAGNAPWIRNKSRWRECEAERLSFDLVSVCFIYKSDLSIYHQISRRRVDRTRFPLIKGHVLLSCKSTKLDSSILTWKRA